MKKIWIMAALVILLACAKTNAQQDMTKVESDSTSMMQVEPQYQDTLVKDFHLMWRVDTLGFLHVKLMAPAKGWVAIGFAPSNIMKDANLIIGYVKADTAYFSDEFGVSLTSHSPDTKLGGTDDIKEKSGMESEDLTEIHFSIPMNSADKYDKVLEKGKIYKIILAAGASDNFTSPHVKTASLMLTI